MHQVRYAAVPELARVASPSSLSIGTKGSTRSHDLLLKLTQLPCPSGRHQDARPAVASTLFRLAIETLTLGLRLREPESFAGIGAAIDGPALAVPDDTTLSRRARTWPSPKCHDRQARPDGPMHVVVDSTGLQVYGADQRGLSERNANVPEDQRVQVRIGINLGEVIVDGDDPEALQVSAPASALRLHPRSDCQSLPLSRHALSSSDHRGLRSAAMATWHEITHIAAA